MSAEAAPASPQRLLPDGKVEIVFNLADPFERLRSGSTAEQPSLLVVGPTSRHMLIRSTGRVELVGIRLRPGSARGLVCGAVEGLRDASAGAERLALDPGELVAELADAPDAADRVRTVWRELASRARGSAPDPLARRVCRWIERSAGRVSVSELAAAAGVSPRTLQRHLGRELGMGAKTYSRLVRFQAALRMLDGRGAPVQPHGWLQAGYCDQSHFLREFRRFAGTSPGGWFRGEDNSLAAEFVALAG